MQVVKWEIIISIFAAVSRKKIIQHSRVSLLMSTFSLRPTPTLSVRASYKRRHSPPTPTHTYPRSRPSTAPTEVMSRHSLLDSSTPSSNLPSFIFPPSSLPP